MPRYSAVLASFALHGVLVGVILWQGKDFIQIAPKPPVIEITALNYDPIKEVQNQQRLAQEQKKAAEQKKLAEQQRRAEQKKQAEKKAEEARQLAAAQKAAEQKKLAEQKKAAEQKKQAEAARKLAEQKKAAEQKKLAAQKKAAEEQRLAEQQKQAQAQQLAQQQEEARQQRLQERQAQQQAQAAADAAAISNMQAVIFELIANEWIRPPEILEKLVTVLEVQLLVTGELLAVKIIKSSGNLAYDQSTLNALHAALPFPLMQLEPRQRDAFRKLTLTFTPEDLARD